MRNPQFRLQIIDSPELAVGITHAILNTAATILFAISFLVLGANHWMIGWTDFAPAVLGFLTVTVGAYIGGSLVFRQGEMVNRNACRSGPKRFVPVLPLSELPKNTPKRVDANGSPVPLVRRGKAVHAIGAVCSHYGAPLDEGHLKDDTIKCLWHCSRFCLADGSVKVGPTTAPVPAYKVRISANQIEIKAK